MQIRDIDQYLQHRLRFITCNRLFGVSLLATTLLKLRNLGHRSIALWDELYHALVARNLLKHFLKPTFYDQPYLPYDYRGWWQGNHIWLHKSPYAMWQIAVSYHIFGVNTFALRFPSLIMSSLAVFITYMIGSELYDRKVGLIAASLQAISPLMMNLVYGYMFSDHINAALIFWVELSCYLLIKGIKTGKTKYYIWSGVAQGFGYLSKSYLCLVSFGILVVIFALTRMNILKPYKGNIYIILWRFWMDGKSSSDDVSYPLFTTESVWYRVQIAVDGRRHIIKVKELSDSTSFNEIKPCMEIDDIHHERGAIGVFGYGYVDNIVVYRIRPDHAKSETLFEDDFESEELDRMPSKWRFFGVSSVGFEAKTVRDPINQNNKVTSVSAPHDMEGTARIIKTNGGIPYLVSTAEYGYPLVYKSPVEPHYRIYRLSAAL